MLKVEHLYKSYQNGKTRYEVLKDVSFEVEEGEFVVKNPPSTLTDGAKVKVGKNS